jgi:CBS domain-containing protein
MKVRDIMTAKPVCCGVTDDLALVTAAMYEKDCGVIVVLGPDRMAVGMITDRDIAIATATRNRPPSMIVASEVITGNIHFCGPDDDLGSALEVMASAQVRRLPVLDSEGRVVGVLSVIDVIRYARNPSAAALRGRVVEALARICQPHGSPEAESAAQVEREVRRPKRAAGKAVKEAVLPGKGPATGKRRGPA